MIEDKEVRMGMCVRESVCGHTCETVGISGYGYEQVPGGYEGVRVILTGYG